MMGEDGLLFGCSETRESITAAVDGMAKEEINAQWQDFMAPRLEGLGGDHVDEGMLALRELSLGLVGVMIRRSLARWEE